MNKYGTVAVAAAVATVGLLVNPAVGQTAASRLSDNDVKSVMEQVDKGVTRFVDGMNPQMRTAILRGERGEFDVKQILKDFRDSIGRMRDRFNPPASSGGTEAMDVLKKAKGIDTGIAQRPGFSGADAKWSDVVPVLTKLAGAYGIDWNADPGTWTAQRVNDKELKDATAVLKNASETYGKKLADAVKKDKGLDAVGKKGATDRIAALTAATKGLDELLKSGSNVTAAVDRTVSAAGDVKSFTGGYAGAAALAPQWSQVETALATIKRAYGISR